MTGILKTKTKHKFKVLFNNFDNNSNILTQNILSCETPDMKSVPVKIVARDDINNQISHMIAWNYHRRTNFDLEIHLLGEHEMSMSIWNLYGCEISNFNNDVLSYENSNPSIFNLFIKYTSIRFEFRLGEDVSVLKTIVF